MTTISAAQVKELRERTGAGMMECKKALVAANGDINAAIEAMRKSGVAKAAKKAGRIASEGVIITLATEDNRCAVMVEVNCETDFVGRDTSFREFATAVAQTALANQETEVSKLAELTLSNQEKTIEQARQELITTLGENIQIRRVVILKADGVVGSYVHSGRIGALVALTTPNLELAKDLAMHVAAANPIALDSKDISAELIAKEKEIFIAQSAESGKPPEIIEKMVAGRISKFVNEVSLLGQPFVKDPNKSINHLLAAEKTTVTDFARFEAGEGIEKEVEDFAQAVMAQIKGES